MKEIYRSNGKKIIITGLITAICLLTCYINSAVVESKTSEKHINVVPTIDSKISNNTNTLYCATFQLAWNELKDNIFKGNNIILSPRTPMAESLNKEFSTKSDLNNSDYIVRSGFMAKKGAKYHYFAMWISNPKVIQ